MKFEEPCRGSNRISLCRTKYENTLATSLRLDLFDSELIVDICNMTTDDSNLTTIIKVRECDRCSFQRPELQNARKKRDEALDLARQLLHFSYLLPLLVLRPPRIGCGCGMITRMHRAVDYDDATQIHGDHDAFRRTGERTSIGVTTDPRNGTMSRRQRTFKHCARGSLIGFLVFRRLA
jgi:hypothetical protein